MTFEVYPVNGNGKEIPTVFAIHGMPYEVKTFDWARPFIFKEKRLTPKETETFFKRFHSAFVKYCLSITKKGYGEIGSDPIGYYYDINKFGTGATVRFKVSFKFLQCYAIAVALDCGLRFD